MPELITGTDLRPPRYTHPKLEVTSIRLGLQLALEPQRPPPRNPLWSRKTDKYPRLVDQVRRIWFLYDRHAFFALVFMPIAHPAPFAVGGEHVPVERGHSHDSCRDVRSLGYRSREYKEEEGA